MSELRRRSFLEKGAASLLGASATSSDDSWLVEPPTANLDYVQSNQEVVQGADGYVAFADSTLELIDYERSELQPGVDTMEGQVLYSNVLLESELESISSDFLDEEYVWRNGLEDIHVAEKALWEPETREAAITRLDQELDVIDEYIAETEIFLEQADTVQSFSLGSLFDSIDYDAKLGKEKLVQLYDARRKINGVQDKLREFNPTEELLEEPPLSADGVFADFDRDGELTVEDVYRFEARQNNPLIGDALGYAFSFAGAPATSDQNLLDLYNYLTGNYESQNGREIKIFYEEGLGEPAEKAADEAEVFARLLDGAFSDPSVVVAPEPIDIEGETAKEEYQNFNEDIDEGHLQGSRDLNIALTDREESNVVKGYADIPHDQSSDSQYSNAAVVNLGAQGGSLMRKRDKGTPLLTSKEDYSGVLPYLIQYHEMVHPNTVHPEPDFENNKLHTDAEIRELDYQTSDGEQQAEIVTALGNALARDVWQDGKIGEAGEKFPDTASEYSGSLREANFYYTPIPAEKVVSR